MFELLKPVSIDLSHIFGLQLSTTYDVIVENIKYEHLSEIIQDNSVYTFNYLSDNNLIVDYNSELYFFKLRYDQVPQSEYEYDVMLNNVEQSEIEFEDDGVITIFKSVSGKELLQATEIVKQSIEDENIGEVAEIYMNILKSDNSEYMMNIIIEGQLLMYIGVQIEKGQII